MIRQSRPGLPPLSNVERLLCQHVAAGETYRIIAARYSLHPKAVETRIRRVRERFGAASATQLVTILCVTGLLADQDAAQPPTSSLPQAPYTQAP